MTDSRVPAPRLTGRVFPDAHGLVARRRDGALVVIDARTGLRARLEGAITSLVEASLERAEPAPEVLALAGAHPALARLVEWLKTPSLRLDVTSAVRLDGWGTLFLELTGRCNERCVHCYAGSSPDVSASLARAEVEAVIDDAVLLGFERIQFTGGDPLLWEDLPSALARATTAGIPTREIFTNGLSLSDRLLAELAPHRPSFAFSFYAKTAELHDRITGVRGSQRRTLAAIERVRAAGLALRVAIIGMDENAGELEESYEFLAERGLQPSWAPSFAVGRGRRYTGELAVSPVRESHRPQGPEGKLCVTYDGEVVPCIFNRTQSLGSIHERPLAMIVACPNRRRPSALGAPAEERLQCVSCRLTAHALAELGR